MTTAFAVLPGQAPPAPFLMRAPQTDPPYDTEEWRPEISRSELGIGFPIQGTLALTFLPTHRLSRSGRPARLEPGSDGDQEPFPGPDRTPRANLPDPRGIGLSLAVALGEALAGGRPTDQLARSFSETAFDAVLAALPVRRRAAQRAAGASPRPRIKIRSLHSFEPADGAAELCAHVVVGERARAVALRLEGIAGRWICTQAQIG